MSGVLGKFAASSPWLDQPAGLLKKAFSPLLGENGPQAVKDLLYGTWLGHPLHPFLTDVTIGALDDLHGDGCHPRGTRPPTWR